MFRGRCLTRTANGQLGFPGGYHLEFTTERQMPTALVANGSLRAREIALCLRSEIQGGCGRRLSWLRD